MKNTLICLLLWAIAHPVFAKHIIGGEITYKYIGNDQYQFFMKIYRDCNGQGAELDDPASITLFRGTSAVRNISVALQNTRFLDKPILPCTESTANPCVQEGSYTWILTLPPINESYMVVYQRCCRNETISNIVAPGNSGASYHIELTPAAQIARNNSPVFRSFPPTLICGNFALNFDHSATDEDGDQLVYEFCSPLLGGGRVGPPDMPGNASACDGVAPIPACLSMMTPVQFVRPTYSATAPLAGNPVVRIHSNTGLITGTPTAVTGQFVVGVCVSEYRNGLLLSVLRRDFQFNVVDCNPTVLASIKADTLIGQEFVIQSCGTNTLSIENQSVKQSFIGNDFYWTFNIGGQERRFNTWNLNLTLPDTGTYKGKLLLKPGEPCSDTADVTVKIYNKPIADFSYTYDTCVAGPISFRDRSSSAAGAISQWKWVYGDGNVATEQHPAYLYQTPGFKNVRLEVEDKKGCKADTTRQIRWQPVPPLLIIEPSRFVDCTPTQTFFKNLSKPIDSTYQITWNFGDGNTGKAISPTHTYTQPGVYSVSLEVISPIGCKTSAQYPNWIKVKQGAKADFDFTPEKLNSFVNTAHFRDLSSFASRWSWFFGNSGYSTEQHPIFTFRDTGLQKIKLLVSNQNNCVDSMIKYLDVEPKVIYHLPNVFSANHDGLNDEFKGKGYLEGMKDFSMRIWNRWGELVFETHNSNEGWNGRKFNTGQEEPQGVYLCVVQFWGPRGARYELSGFATLLR